MAYLRSFLFNIFLITFTVFYACICLISFPFVKLPTRYKIAQVWCRINLSIAKYLCGLDYRVQGLEHYQAVLGQPVIVLAKHQSAWETIAISALLKPRLCYIFKYELLFVPFFGWALGLLRMIHVNRKQGSQAFLSVVQQGKQRLSEGAWMILFPEGTRTLSGANSKYKTGGARLAVATNAFVLPIAHNAGRYWPKNSLLKKPGCITVSIGPAIPSAGKTAEELNNEVATWIENEMRIIDADSYLLPAVTPAPAPTK